MTSRKTLKSLPCEAITSLLKRRGEVTVVRTSNVKAGDAHNGGQTGAILPACPEIGVAAVCPLPC